MIRTSVLFVVLVFVCAACGSSPAPSPTPGPAANVTVSIVGSAGSQSFSPNPVPVPAGQTVAFRNSNNTVHHIVANDGSWDTGNLNAGSTSAAIAVPSAVSKPFHCTIHPTMTGSIN